MATNNDHPSPVQLPTSLTSTPTMRYSPFPRDPKPSVYLGMDQLGFFLNILKDRLENYLSDEVREHFWQVIRQDCPEMMQVLDERRETGGLVNQFHAITFSSEMVSQAFDYRFYSTPESEQAEKERM